MRGLAVLLKGGEVAAIQASQEERRQMYPFVSSSCLGLGGGHVFIPRLLWAISQASQASSLAGVLFGPRVQEYMGEKGDVKMNSCVTIEEYAEGENKGLAQEESLEAGRCAGCKRLGVS